MYIKHQPHDCWLNRLFRRRSKKTSKLGVTGLRVGNSPVTGEFPAQRASNEENVSIWWRHHDIHSLCAAVLCCVLLQVNYDHIYKVCIIGHWVNNAIASVPIKQSRRIITMYALTHTKARQNKTLFLCVSWCPAWWYFDSSPPFYFMLAGCKSIFVC